MAKSNPDKNAFFTTPDTFDSTDKHVPVGADTPQPEMKSRRAYLLVQPSVWDALSTIAKKTHRSNNDIINELIKRFVEENK